jgi:hypothetical protein
MESDDEYNGDVPKVCFAKESPYEWNYSLSLIAFVYRLSAFSVLSAGDDLGRNCSATPQSTFHSQSASICSQQLHPCALFRENCAQNQEPFFMTLPTALCGLLVRPL